MPSELTTLAREVQELDPATVTSAQIRRVFTRVQPYLNGTLSERATASMLKRTITEKANARLYGTIDLHRGDASEVIAARAR